jgi:hypothetical protein
MTAFGFRKMYIEWRHLGAKLPSSVLLNVRQLPGS